MHRFILFLDFDGVLHPGTSGTFRHAPLLATYLDAYPFVRIVISSNWRFSESVDELKGWFAPSMASRIIGATPILAGGAEGSRQQEIEHWLAEHPTQLWRALDDDATLFSPTCPWLIRTEPKVGLTAQTLAALDTVLKAVSG